MSMFTLAISYLTTSNLPWFMDLTFQVPVQYCSLPHWTLLPSPVTPTTGQFLLGSVSSFFLDLFLHSSPVAYWAPNNLGSSSFSVLLFAFSYYSWGSQGKNTEVICYSLLQSTPFCQNTTLTCLSRVAIHGMAHSFIELDKAVIQVISLFQFNSVQSFSHVRLFATSWIAACQASVSITNSRGSLRLTSIESVMPSSHLILCSPLLLLTPIPPSIRVFSNESTLHMRWPKDWSFSFSIIPSIEIPGLISFRIDWLDLLAVQRDSQESSPTPHFKSINSSVLSFLHSPTLPSIHDYWKNHSLD